MKSKRYKKLPENTNMEKPDTINNLIPIIKKNCTTKFDESIDLSILINNKQKKMKLILEQLLIFQVELEKKSKLQLLQKTINKKMQKTLELT